jgi:hypothetical protein
MTSPHFGKISSTSALPVCLARASFDACSVSVQRPDFCYMVHRAGAGESKSLGMFFDKHPSESFGKKMDKLCLKVCYGKMTVIAATRKFCPHQQPHSMEDVRVDPGIPGSTAR